MTVPNGLRLIRVLWTVWQASYPANANDKETQYLFPAHYLMPTTSTIIFALEVDSGMGGTLKKVRPCRW